MDKYGDGRECCQSTLENCLYIPSYPENIFSVKAANRKGSSVCFYPDHAELIANDGTVFEIKCVDPCFISSIRTL